MGQHSLIFSRDTNLSQHIKTVLESSCGETVHLCTSLQEARAADRGKGTTKVFADLRVDTTPAQTEELLQDLSVSKAPVNLLIVSDGFYPRKLAALADLISIERIDVPIESLELERKLAKLNGGIKAPPRFVTTTDEHQLATYSSDLAPLIDQLTRVAVRNVVVLLVGETGTGKTTLARLIHQLSPRKNEPFQNVACGALPCDLIESELFGHVRGAFTGADRSKMGRFEAAGSGSLLLDEIDVLGPKEQAKLLRVIETGEYELVGSTETRTSKARLIVASNIDLETLMEQMAFRSDLYYRLNVLEFKLPPLRDRQVDIVPMALQFIDECCLEHEIEIRRVHQNFLEAIKQYHWPGNIRELKNQMQRAVLFCETGDLTTDDLSPGILKSNGADNHRQDKTSMNESLAKRVARGERAILEEALKANNYNRTQTARTLGMSRVGLYKKMRKYNMLDLKKQAS